MGVLYQTSSAFSSPRFKDMEFAYIIEKW